MKRGQAAQEWLLDLDAPTSGDSSAVSAAGVRNALVHDWEHMAMTAKGGTLGLGYGRAPATQSFIRQDTIQYDSVFSFFIAGEHGMLGGAALLLIYLAPVAVLLARRNERFHIGDVVAVLIACMLAGEAFAHAAMNTSQLWFSGRNLPLLATASPSDLMRWTLLLGLGAQALLWSRRREGSGEMDSEPFFTERAVYDETYGRPRRRAIRLALIGAVIIAPVLLAVITGALGWMVVALAVPLAILLVKDRAPAIMVLPVAVVAVLLGYGWWRARSSPEYETFTWSRLLSRVDRYSQEGLLRFDPTRHLLQFNGGDGFTARPRGRSLIEAEVLRFNAMPAADRLAGDRASLDASFARLRSPADYQNAVRALWAQECERPLQRRPALFTVERLPHDEDDPRATFRVTGNPRFNVVHSFHDPLEKGDIATVSIGEGAQAVTLIGPAWVMGRWTHATSPDAGLGLGWMRHLGATLGQMPAERRRLIRRLTLDPALQEAATSAVDAAGRSLHQRLLAERAQMPLPPRVALTIMRTTTGETLALGSWPRSSSGRVWSSRRVADGAHPPWTELEPPSTWIDSTAPPAITSRYSGDHNFAALEMGSATKPFWATAALTVHPRLAELLLTRNGTCDSVVDKKCSENQIFGATAGRGWRVPAGERWVGFNNYLALSDNRYQIRLGLLAFARGTADGGIADDGRGPIPSGRESLSGRMQPWDRFPQFGEGMTISRTRPQQITNLHTQPAADAMRDLFGVSTGSHTGAPLRRRRVSFWSGDERDDVRSGQAYDALESVSPDATHLALNRIRETRSLIAILLGGLTNRWSNVHAASAFSSWALGRPIIAHITADATPNALAVRTAKFQAGGADAARRLRPGLRAIFEAGGTANSLLPIIARYREAGYEVYAKTGTLASVDRERPTSRIILTIVRSGDAPDGGVTISFVAERATSGFAVDAVGSFLTAHADLIDRALQPQ
jgi:cell division protein FtsW (lipid II flippase)